MKMQIAIPGATEVRPAVNARITSEEFMVLSRGGVFATSPHANYKLNEHRDWQVFYPYRTLGASANGRFWVVRDEHGSAWRIEF